MRLIDADALITRLEYCVTKGMGSTIAFTFKHIVDEQPTIEERKTGRWIYQDDRREVTGNDWYCSECGNGVRYQDHYCPNCGAKMEVEYAEI